MTVPRSDIFRLLGASGADFPPPPWTEIGRGVWGTVYDLGDGTVLKLCNRAGGIGDGLIKLAREIDLLGRIGGLATDLIRLPALADHHRFDPEAPHGFAGWLRLERLPGEPLRETSLAKLSGADHRRRGERMGAAVAAFHTEAGALRAGPGPLYPDPIARGLGEAEPYLKRIGRGAETAALAEAWARATRGVVMAPCHGDPNLSNMLWPDDDPLSGPVGLVDFAEAGLGAAEGDLRHAEDFGPLTQSFLDGFRAEGGPVDPERLAIVAAVNACGKLYFATRSGTPKTQALSAQRLDRCLARAGIAI